MPTFLESFKYYENDFQKACFAPALRVRSGGGGLALVSHKNCPLDSNVQL